MTNAMPVLGDKWRNRSIAASNPPAEPPIPTIGQPRGLVAVVLLLDARGTPAAITACRRARGFFVFALEGTPFKQCLTSRDVYRQIGRDTYWLAKCKGRREIYLYARKFGRKRIW